MAQVSLAASCCKALENPSGSGGGLQPDCLLIGIMNLDFILPIL